jgi:serine protease AprX
MKAQSDLPKRAPDDPEGGASQVAGVRVPVIDARVRQAIEAGAETLRVFVVLRSQPHREVLERHEGPSTVWLEMLESRVRTASTRSPTEAQQAQAELERQWREVRRMAFEEIRRQIEPEQYAVEGLILSLGGRNIRRFAAINMLAADVPAGAIATLSADPLVREISLVERQTAELNISVPTLGATSFWTYGYAGAGQSVAVLDSGVRTNHPAFFGLSIVSRTFLDHGKLDPCFSDNANSPEDYDSHGTHVAGIVASRGDSYPWTDYLGVAKSLGTLYNLKVGYKGGWDSAYQRCDPNLGTSDHGDVYAALDWLVQNAPSVKILNYSYGGKVREDDDPQARRFDYLADAYGLVITTSAGNSGPNLKTITSPGNAYNLITVANVDSKGTVSRSDDVIDNSSSRGPTWRDRRKPDLAAPGTNIRSAAYDWDGGFLGSNPNFVSKSGTSMAAPHIAGAAALLRQAGITDPLAIKALLLNTTDSLTWRSDWGWGYANLARTWEQLGNAVVSTVPNGSHKLYRVRNPSLFYATLVWNRWVYTKTGPDWCLSDLDLWLYGGTTNNILGFSISSIDNVEKAYTDTAGEVVVKVRHLSSPPCSSAERFALATSNAVTAATGPDLTVSCSGPSLAAPGAQFTVTCTARNIGDLWAFGVQGPLNWSGGSGGANQIYGDLSPGAQASRSWSVVAPSIPGAYTLRADVTSASYGISFSGTANFTFRVGNSAPAPVQVSPASGTGSSQVFTFAFADPDGWQDLAVVNVLINFWLDGRQACYLAYAPATGSLYLVDDVGNAGGPYQGMSLPGSGSIGNSQCIVYGSGSSASGSGNTLTLTLNVAFRPSFAGTRLIYLAARDRANANSNWQRLGVWTVPGLPLTSPAVVSMSPQRGSGAGPAAFTFQFYDADGYQDLNVLNILVNDWLDGRRACYLAYVRPLDGVYLVNDAGDGLLPLLRLTGAGSVSNSQCTVYGAGSSASGSGSTLTLRLNLSFGSAFSGNRVFYLAARDSVEQNSGWQAMGTWTVP